MDAESVLEVLDVLEAAGVGACLDGGWGVDALLGEQTRDHADLDLIVERSAERKLEMALETVGFRRRAGGADAGLVLADDRGRQIDVHRVDLDLPGYACFRLPDGRRWPFPSGAFAGRGRIAGRTVRCLSVQAQVACHAQGYEPTQSDLLDMARLQQRFGVVLPLSLCSETKPARAPLDAPTPEQKRETAAQPVAGDARIRAAIDRLIAKGSVVAEVDGTPHDVRTVSISPGEGEALTRWVVRERATRTIEVGLAYGFSALHICRGLIASGDPQARHVVLDPFQATRFANCGLRVLEEAGVASLVEVHEQESQIALPAFLEQGRQFDLGFVDGNHRFDGVFLDLFYLGHLLPKGSVVVLDDADLPGIRRAISFFLTNLEWRVEETSPADDPHQWVVLRTAESTDQRDFRHFVDF